MGYSSPIFAIDFYSFVFIVVKEYALCDFSSLNLLVYCMRPSVWIVSVSILSVLEKNVICSVIFVPIKSIDRIIVHIRIQTNLVFGCLVNISY